MFRGTQQGGGGSEFINLTGLFKTKSGKGYVGYVKPQEFYQLRELLDQCERNEQDIMFFVGSGKPGDKVAARLSVAPASGGGASSTSTRRGGGYQPRSSRASGSRSPVTSSPQKENPPKDPLDNFLEDFDNQ